MILIALVGRRGHEEEVIRHPGERFAEPIGVGLSILGWGAHLVGFVHNDEIPARAEQAFTRIFDK